MALGISACSSPLPDSVVVGSSASVGWAHSLTSTNTASTDGATPGNADVAAMTRSQFAEVVEGAVEVDESFGTVTIVDPESLTVRYELAEPVWSDGIPVDAADLLLAWAAGSNVPGTGSLRVGSDSGTDDDDGAAEPLTVFDSVDSGLRDSIEVVGYDEFERWIEVRFIHPVADWRTALDVAVPAHVVGQMAFDLDDPMEAKQAIITVIDERDEAALATIAEVWNSGFDLPQGTGEIAPELLLSSGPYRIEEVDQSRTDAQAVRLVVNNEYTGFPTGEYERITLTQMTASDPLAELGRSIDVVQVPPTDDNWERIRDLERVDYGVSTTHTGSMWALLLNSDRGEFTWLSARETFLRAVPQADLASAGAGRWTDAYQSTSAVVFSPDMPGYQIALEDAGFNDTLGEQVSGDEAAQERSEAGVEDGAEICVLYDTDERFAADAFGALQGGVAEAGWEVRDCGTDDLQSELDEGSAWDAVLTTIPVPVSADQVQVQWGTDGASLLAGGGDEERDDLIEALGRAADEYQARDIRVGIEASIVAEAVVMPLSMQPVVTINERGIDSVRPRAGDTASVTANAVEWSVPE